jgi:hypothetical protein
MTIANPSPNPAKNLFTPEILQISMVWNANSCPKHLHSPPGALGWVSTSLSNDPGSNLVAAFFTHHCSGSGKKTEIGALCNGPAVKCCRSERELKVCRTPASRVLLRTCTYPGFPFFSRL